MQTIKVTTVPSRPFVMPKSTGGYEGFIVDLLDTIATRMNIKYDLQLSKDGGYGAMQPNGSWNGMIGELVRGEADIAAAPLTVTSMRARVVSFTKPFLADSVRLLVKKPTRHELGLGSLLEPFSSEVWCCLIFAAIVVSILFMLIGRFNPYEWRQVPSDKDPRGARHSFGLRDSLMFVFSSLFLQGYRETPRSLAGRTLAVSWFAAVFFILAAYIGICGPFLSIQRVIAFPFQNLEDLTQQTTIQVGTVQSGSTYSRLMHSSNPNYRRLFENQGGVSPFVKTGEEGVERVRDSYGRYVFITQSLYGKYMAETDPSCSLMLYGPSLFSTAMALAVPKDSLLKAPLSMAILQLTEDGTIQMLQDRWWNIGRCADTEMVSAPKIEAGPRVSQLTIRRMDAPFIILIFGALLSLVIMIGEYVFNKCRQ